LSSFFADSVIFVQKKGEKIIRYEESLGGLTDEVHQEFGAGATITAFMSCGPKNYAYEVKLRDGSTKVIRKVKGISIKYNCLEETSMETLEKLITGELDQVEINVIRKIERAAGFQLFTSDSKKKLRMVYDKRARIGVNTHPWGTKQGAAPVVPNPNIDIPTWKIRNHFYS
jgi:hypothetical protein